MTVVRFGAGLRQISLKRSADAGQHCWATRVERSGGFRVIDGAANHGDDNKLGSSHPCDKRDNELREPTELQTVIVLVHWAQSE